MQYFKEAVLAVAIALGMAACQSGTKPAAEQEAGTQLTPAEPAGTIQVSFTHENDTQQVKIHFTIGNQAIEKSFDLPLAKDVDREDLYRTVWDKPNSCYIGVLKQNRSTRYYHASQKEDGDLQIFQVGTPPAAVWHYAEDKLGLGKVSAKKELTDSYQRNLQSGNIIADFIVRLEPASGEDSVQLYTEFGGVNRKQTLAVPKGYVPMIQLTGEADHCIFGLRRDDGFHAVLDIKVRNGNLQLTEVGRVF